MEWTIEKDKTSGALWIASPNGDICDMYFRQYANHGDWKVVHFTNAEANARLIAKAPHQQALIDELVGVCKASKEYVAKAEGWEVLKRLEHLIAKAEKGE